MFFNQFFFPLIAAFLFFNVAFALGSFILEKLRISKENFLFDVAYSVLLGYGVLGYLAVIFSYLGIFNAITISGAGLLVIILGRRNLIYLQIR